MTGFIVITRHLAVGAGVIRVMHMVVIFAVVAVLVVSDVRVHISLIMTQVNRSRLVIVMRIIVPIVRRTPWIVMRHSPTSEHRRRAYKHRTNVVVGTIDVRSADNLHIRCRVTHLYRQSSHVLEDIMRQYCLDNNHVVKTVHSLNNAQIINISVSVKVKRRKHVRG